MLQKQEEMSYVSIKPTDIFIHFDSQKYV